jgi:hypothetical protein
VQIVQIGIAGVERVMRAPGERDHTKDDNETLHHCSLTLFPP